MEAERSTGPPRRGRDGDQASPESPRPSPGAPEYPHYTRPAEWRGWTVPEVLLSGHHARIRQWRLEQSGRRAGS